MKTLQFYEDVRHGEPKRTKRVKATVEGLKLASEWLRANVSNSVKFNGNRYRECSGWPGVSKLLAHVEDS